MRAVNKQDFLIRLREGLAGLPQDEIEERLTFYGEMIDDRMEEGLTEEEAVTAAGTVEEIVSQTVAEIPLAKIAKERIKPKRRLKAWEIILLVLGSPVWLSLAIAAFAVILSLYIVLWSLIIVLWAVFVTLVACAVAGAVSGTVYLCTGKVPGGLALIGGGVLCAGLSIFMFFGCKAASRGIIKLTKKLALAVKHCFIRKGDA